MKKYLLPLVFILALNTHLHSQNLSFDQTVEYLRNFIGTSANLVVKNEIYCHRSGDRIDSISVSRDGRIGFFEKRYSDPGRASLNVSDIARGTWEIGYDSNPDLQYIKNKCPYSPHLNLYDNSGKLLIIFCGLTNADGNRLYKALLHLRTVSSKDPFGN